MTHATRPAPIHLPSRSSPGAGAAPPTRHGALAVLVIALALFGGVTLAQEAGEAERGRLLYQNHCLGCHASAVHVRSARKARDPAQLRWQIARWQHVESLGWRFPEMADVYAYLNREYYHFEP